MWTSSFPLTEKSVFSPVCISDLLSKIRLLWLGEFTSGSSILSSWYMCPSRWLRSIHSSKGGFPCVWQSPWDTFPILFTQSLQSRSNVGVFVVIVTPLHCRSFCICLWFFFLHVIQIPGLRMSSPPSPDGKHLGKTVTNTSVAIFVQATCRYSPVIPNRSSTTVCMNLHCVCHCGSFRDGLKYTGDGRLVLIECHFIYEMGTSLDFFKSWNQSTQPRQWGQVLILGSKWISMISPSFRPLFALLSLPLPPFALLFPLSLPSSFPSSFSLFLTA